MIYLLPFGKYYYIIDDWMVISWIYFEFIVICLSYIYNEFISLVNQKLIHDTIHILITMRISQYFEWNQNFLNFYYFIDFESQMGNIMIWEYFDATSPPLSHFFLLLFFNGFESFKLLWRLQVYFGHYISLGVFWSFWRG